jgi:hypothetical protein
MLPPLKRSIPEHEQLPEVRFVLNGCPELGDHPECLAAELEAEEQAVRVCLEVLHLEGCLCP